MLSQKTRYALKAMIALASAGTEGSLTVGDIAEQQNLPRKFLEAILLELKRQGLVHSLRGRTGGYVLARPADEISFGQIVRVMQGPLALLPCVSQTAYRRCDDCPDERACAIRRVLADVRGATATIMDGHTLADAVKPVRRPRRRPAG
jgi:Rrf2 family protein